MKGLSYTLFRISAKTVVMIISKQVITVLIISATLGALAGCESGLLDADLKKGTSYDCRMVKPNTGDSGIATIDDWLASIGHGFGGMFYEPDPNRLNIYMLNPNDDKAVQTVQRRLKSRWGQTLKDAKLQVLQGQYAIRQLNEWKDLANNIMGLQGVTTLDLDEGENRVMFGVAPDNQKSARRCVEKNIDHLSIPQEAVRILTRKAAREL